MSVIPLTPSLDHLREHIPIARVGDDVEGVHQVRVATRRLDVWLRLAGQRTFRDDLAWLRRGASSVRDLDVVLERDLPGPLRAWLVEEHQVARTTLIECLDDERLGALLIGLSVTPPVDADRAAARLRRIARRCWKLGKAAERSAGDIERIHRLRRALRRVRYGLEWTGGKAKPIKRLQDSFGAVNDHAVTIALLERCPARAGLADFRSDLERRLREGAAGAIEGWRASRELVKALR